VKNDERRSEDHASSRDISFNKLLPSKARMRRVNAGVSIEQLAENIAQRTAGLERPNETGMFEVPAGGRRYRAPELLVHSLRRSRRRHCRG